jgi:hypothetical protein
MMPDRGHYDIASFSGRNQSGPERNAGGGLRFHHVAEEVT